MALRSAGFVPNIAACRLNVPMPQPTAAIFPRRSRRFPLLPALLLSALTTAVGAAQAAPPAMTEEACATPPHPSWSAEEKWLWSERLCRGKAADLNDLPGCAAAPKADQPAGWPACRAVGNRFVRMVLLAEPWRSALPDSGMVIENARFSEKLDLSGATVDHRLVLRFSRFDGGLDFSRAVFNRFVALGGSATPGRINLNQATIRYNLFAKNGVFPVIDAVGARIDGDADFEGSRFADAVNLSDAVVGGNLFLSHGAYGKLIASGVRSRGSVFLEGSRVADALLLDGARIDGWLTTGGGVFTGPVDLSFARIGRNLELGGGDFTAVEATGLTVDGALRLGDRNRGRAVWRGDSRLNLQNARAAIFSDTPESWATLKRFDLTGFDYQRLGAPGLSDDPADLGGRSGEWYGAWLARSVGPSSQPYEQLARELVRLGRPGVADEVMYTARERELAREEKISRILWGWFNKIVIGHGYRLEYALYLSLALLVIGVFAAPRTYKDIRLGWRLRIFFSITMFIPFLEINKRAALERLDDTRAIFFYGMIVCGVVIPAMVAAALLGAIH
jgi:hypothetical protein